MANLSLVELQALFNRMVLQGNIPDELADQIIPGGTLTVQNSLLVYERGYHARLTEALGETYEGIWWVLGDEGFFLLAKKYLNAHPSDTYTLSNIGRQLPSFLHSYSETKDFPFLPDLARYEWLFHELFHRQQHPSISPDALQQVLGAGDAALKFGAAVALFEAPYSVYNIWRRKNADPNDRSPIHWDQPQHLLLYKHQQRILVKELEGQEARILGHLLQGKTIEETITEMSRDGDDLSEAMIGPLFQLIFNTGIIQDIRPIENDTINIMNSASSHS